MKRLQGLEIPGSFCCSARGFGGVDHPVWVRLVSRPSFAVLVPGIWGVWGLGHVDFFQALGSGVRSSMAIRAGCAAVPIYVLA